MPEPKLLDKVRSELRTKHYSRKTETAYSNWIRRFILFNDKRHLKYMGAEEIKSFVDNLVTNHHLSSATQNQALNAILYLYKNVIKKEIKFVDGLGYVKRVNHLPVVFSRNEAAEIIKNLDGTVKLIVSLLYGSGMRLGKVLSLRVKDIDFEMNHIIVRDGK